VAAGLHVEVPIGKANLPGLLVYPDEPVTQRHVRANPPQLLVKCSADGVGLAARLGQPRQFLGHGAHVVVADEERHVISPPDIKISSRRNHNKGWRMTGRADKIAVMPDALSNNAALCDPVTLEIVRGAVRATQAEMEALIERTSISPFIREKKDFYTALFDAQGVMAVGSNLPVFGDICGPVFRDFPPETMREGDLYWYKDCHGSRGAISHSNDQLLLAPVFHEGRRCGFVMGWAHFSDIGGLRAGSISPDTTDIFQEGIIVPPTRLIDAGVTNEMALRIFYRNSRYPEQNLGDMSALMATTTLGVRRIEEIVARFG